MAISLLLLASAAFALTTAKVVYDSSSGNLTLVSFPLGPSILPPFNLVTVSAQSTAVDFTRNVMYSIMNTQELPPGERRLATTSSSYGILRMHIQDGSRRFLYLPRESQPTGLGIDDITGVLFMTDGVTNTIEVINFDKEAVATLIWMDVNNPSNVIVDAESRRLFWLNKAGTPSIEVANLDGNNRRALVSPNSNFPSTLALDQPGRRLYWVGDAAIESIGLDGTSRQRDADLPFNNIHSIAVDNDFFYLTTTHNSSVLRVSKTVLSTGSYESFGNSEVTPTKVSVHLKTANPTGNNPCSSTMCSHICVRNDQGRPSCLCPHGYAMQPDQTSCQMGNYESVLYVADYERKRIFQVDLDNGAVRPLKNTGMSKAYSLTGDSEKRTLYWSDPDVNLYSCQLDKECRNVVAPLQLKFRKIHALAINTKDSMIYMSLIPNSLDSSMIAEVPINRGDPYRVIISDETKPVSLAYDPKTKCLFWTDPVAGKIYRHNMTGDSLTERVTGGVTNLHTVQVYGPSLYWSHNEGISTCFINGKTSRSFLSKPGSQVQSFVLTEDKVYYAVNGGRNVYWAMRNDTSKYGTLGQAMFGNITSMFYKSPEITGPPPPPPPIWPIVAGVASGVVLMAVIAGLCWYYRVRRRRLDNQMPVLQRQMSGPYDNLDEYRMDDFPGYRTSHIRASRLDPPYLSPTTLQTQGGPVVPETVLGSNLQSPLHLPKHGRSLLAKPTDTNPENYGPQRHTFSESHGSGHDNKRSSEVDSTYLKLLPSQQRSITDSEVSGQDA